MPGIGSFRGNYDKYSTVCNSELAQMLKEMKTQRGYWSLNAFWHLTTKDLCIFVEVQLGECCHFLESHGYGWSLEQNLVFPWQSTHCFKLSECFLWHSICSADVKNCNYFIFSMLDYTLFMFPFWKFLLIHKEFQIQTLFTYVWNTKISWVSMSYLFSLVE